MKNLSPCLNCPDRKVTETYNCHSDCSKYKLYDEANEVERMQRAAKAKIIELDDMLFKRYPKRKKRRNK